MSAESSASETSSYSGSLSEFRVPGDRGDLFCFKVKENPLAFPEPNSKPLGVLAALKSKPPPFVFEWSISCFPLVRSKPFCDFPLSPNVSCLLVPLIPKEKEAGVLAAGVLAGAKENGFGVPKVKPLVTGAGAETVVDGAEAVVVAFGGMPKVNPPEADVTLTTDGRPRLKGEVTTGTAPSGASGFLALHATQATLSDSLRV